jgi:PAS domain S-box-containing protein
VFNLAFSPVLGEAGAVGGVLVTALEAVAAEDSDPTGAALRRSEARYRALLESIDEGFCVFKVLFDEEDRPVDYLWLETNTAFERHTGLVGAVGRTAREMVPGLEQHWVEIYGRIARTGRRERFVEGSQAMGRWFEVEAFRIGQPEERAVALLFTDISARRRVEAALQESEARYRNLFASMDEGFCVIERIGGDAGQPLDFRYIEANPAFLRQTGLPDVIGRSIREIAPGEADEWIETYTGVARTGESARFTRVLQAQGRVLELHAFRVEDDEHRRVAVTFADVTARKRAEVALRQAAEADAYRVRLTDALRPLADPQHIQAEAARVLGEHLGACHVHHALLSEDGVFATVEAEYRGEGSGSLLGRHRVADYGPSMIAELRAGRTLVVNDAAQDPRLQAAERATVAARGAVAAVTVPLFKGARAVALFTAYHAHQHQWTDEEIALVEETAERTWSAVERAQADEKRRQAEEARRESAARLQFALEAAQIGDWDLDLTSGQAHTSLRHDRCFGYQEPVPEWGMEIFLRHVHPQDREAVQAKFRRAAESLHDWHFECRVIWPDSSVHWIAAHGGIYYVNGEPSRMLGIVFDITERKRVEETVRKANAQLVESDRRKDEFLAMLAHELRNPLAAIRNTLRLLDRTELGEARRFVEILQRQAGSLTGMVDDLLDVSRVTRGLISVERHRLDLVEVIRSALESQQGLLDELGHQVNVELPSQAVPISGDRLRLEQVAVNLINNAAKYTDPGGRIDVSLRIRAERAELRVRDSGIGMTADDLTRVFALFGQAERGLDRAQGGLGIGLTVVKSLVELHGGEVEARSEGPGRGSEFLVTLPLAYARAEPQAIAEADAPKAARSRRVLVVDDSRDIAETLAMLLEDSGHQVRTAHSGPEALAMVREVVPELILLDIGLPGMDGYEVARRLREDQATRAVRLVALTGYGQASDRERASQAGFDAHFVKPVDLDVLEAFVNAER